MFSWQEMLVVFIVLLLLFGGKKLPELARGLGKAVNEFRNTSSGVKSCCNADQKTHVKKTVKKKAKKVVKKAVKKTTKKRK